VTSVTYVPATPGRPGPPRASIPGSPYPDLGTPASLKVAIAETADAARFLPALCRTELTGDCADGVAMVIEHPRVVDTATPGP
jgi:hypothetical protein